MSNERYHMHIPGCGIRSILAVGALVFVGCAQHATVEAAAAQQIGLDIQPGTAQVAAGGKVTFTAVVTGAVNVVVNWNVVESGGGTIDGTGVYTAPQTPGTYHVRASTPVDPTVQATAAVTVNPQGTVAVAVNPTTGAVDSCGKLSFSATVTGATDTSVTWTVQEGAAGGAIDANGVYTAPNAAGTYHVVATCRADPTKSATAQVSVTDHIISIAVTPSTTAVAPGGKTQFTATVNTSCGAFTAARPIGSAGGAQ
jgi:hypothetical protein